MHDLIARWLDVNDNLVEVGLSVSECALGKIKEDASARVLHLFASKATRTLRAITLLYREDLAEQAQALVRVLVELSRCQKITFIYGHAAE